MEGTIKICRMFLVFDESVKESFAVSAEDATTAIAMVQTHLGSQAGSAAAMVATPHSIYKITDIIKE